MNNKLQALFAELDTLDLITEADRFDEVIALIDAEHAQLGIKTPPMPSDAQLDADTVLQMMGGFCA